MLFLPHNRDAWRRHWQRCFRLLDSTFSELVLKQHSTHSVLSLSQCTGGFREPTGPRPPRCQKCYRILYLTKLQIHLPKNRQIAVKYMRFFGFYWHFVRTKRAKIVTTRHISVPQNMLKMLEATRLCHALQKTLIIFRCVYSAFSQLHCAKFSSKLANISSSYDGFLVVHFLSEHNVQQNHGTTVTPACVCRAPKPYQTAGCNNNNNNNKLEQKIKIK